ncbi:hypothetical protein R5H32_02710 [Defluviimonas sp. D31]|uniref:hypothetical protein n=1 Tax=Defluviimonas sp. D31 TaxID=3083253 RepID=UPI00296E6207|nr:hypothetical protein [Defluviimonas sp. D31]MDW4548259.1 hypothetical protein [Defluviimonas sp. D31]
MDFVSFCPSFAASFSITSIVNTNSLEAASWRSFTMRTFEASLKITDPHTGAITYRRLFTRRAKDKHQVAAEAVALGLAHPMGELIVYPF